MRERYEAEKSKKDSYGSCPEILYTCPVTIIARPSVASLLLQMRVRDQALGTGTGFVVKCNSHHYLVTNYHNLAGRRPDTNELLHDSGATPDSVVITHNSASGLGSWVSLVEPVVDNDDKPLWIEHPKFKRKVDVVALLLRNLVGVKLYPYQYDEVGPDIAVGVSRGVNIIGFPFGLTGGGAFGIWSRGTIATEPEIDFNDLPLFLIDSRTRPGQSGSPVIIYHDGGMIPMKDGASAIFGGPVERLLGIYSGRINKDSDLGFVWKASVIREILVEPRGQD